MINKLSEIDETTSLEERLDVFACLVEMGWSHDEAEAVTGVDCSIDLDVRNSTISVLVPTMGGMH